LHCITRLDQQRLILGPVWQRCSTLEQQIDKAKVYRANHLAEGSATTSGARHHLLAERLQRVHRLPIGGDGRIEIPQRLEQPPCLPLPAVQRLRRLHLLRGKQRLTRELQRFAITLLFLVEPTQVPQGIRQSTLVVDGTCEVRCGVQRRSGTEGELGFVLGQRGTQASIGQPNVDETV